MRYVRPQVHGSPLVLVNPVSNAIGVERSYVGDRGRGLGLVCESRRRNGTRGLQRIIFRVGHDDDRKQTWAGFTRGAASCAVLSFPFLACEECIRNTPNAGIWR